MQSIWRVYEYLTQTVHPYMVATDQCLYNAVVRTMADQSDAYLDQVRTAALDLANGIAAELADRQTDREAALEAARPSGGWGDAGWIAIEPDASEAAV